MFKFSWKEYDNNKNSYIQTNSHKTKMWSENTGETKLTSILEYGLWQQFWAEQDKCRPGQVLPSPGRWEFQNF